MFQPSINMILWNVSQTSSTSTETFIFVFYERDEKLDQNQGMKIYKQTTGKCNLLHMTNRNNLSMRDLLRGHIAHVFCSIPDVCTFHTKFYCTTSGHVGSTRWPQTSIGIWGPHSREVTCKDLCNSSEEWRVCFQQLCNPPTQEGDGGVILTYSNYQLGSMNEHHQKKHVIQK